MNVIVLLNLQWAGFVANIFSVLEPETKIRLVINLKALNELIVCPTLKSQQFVR